MHRLMEGTSPRHFDGTSLTPENHLPILNKPCHCAATIRLAARFGFVEGNCPGRIWS